MLLKFFIKMLEVSVLNVPIFSCDNVPQIICITEMWLNGLFYNHSLFPDNYFVLCADRDYVDSR
jgi:hypothetical protein